MKSMTSSTMKSTYFATMLKSARRHAKGTSYFKGTARYQCEYEKLVDVAHNTTEDAENADLMTIFRVIHDAYIYACAKPGTTNRNIGKWWIANRKNYTFKDPEELMQVFDFLTFKACVPISVMEGMMHSVVSTVVKGMPWNELYTKDLKYYNAEGDHQEDFATLYHDMAMDAEFSKTHLANVLRSAFNIHMSRASMSTNDFNNWWDNEGEDACMVHCIYANASVYSLAEATDAKELDDALDEVITLAKNVRAYAKKPFMARPATHIEHMLTELYTETTAELRDASCFSGLLKAFSSSDSRVRS